MKILFEGTPEQVLKDMREFIARLSVEFGDREEKATVALNDEKRALTDAIHLAIKDSPTGLTGPIVEKTEVVEKKSKPPQTSGPRVCQYCGKSIGKAGPHAVHEKHCKANPSRPDHQFSGKPKSPLSRPGRESGQKNSPPRTIGESNESWPNGTLNHTSGGTVSTVPPAITGKNVKSRFA